MINPKTKLTVFHDDNGVFTDHTDSASDYIRDDFSMTLVSLEDYVYIGYYKPFNSVYVEFSTANVNSNDFALEYYDGTTWTTLELDDDTKGWTRSGFMHWDKSDMNEVEINSTTKYYIRMKPDSDHSATTLSGLNLVFSDDNQLKQEFFEIDNANLLPSGQSSHINSHVASRNTIIQMLRNQGYIKTNSSTGQENIDQFDLHDVFEIRQAATYMALSKIFFNLSDSVDDNWWAKYKEYQDKFEGMFALAKLTLDQDDDGNEDSEEKRNYKSKRWNR